MTVKTTTTSKRKPKNPITKVRTGSGDSGTTYLREPGIPKTDPLVDFVGTLDETCAAMAMCELSFDFGSAEEADIQRELDVIYSDVVKAFFMIGAMVHSEEAKANHLHRLDELQVRMEDSMSAIVEGGYVDPLDGFIVPNPENADLFFVRAVVRRCEREAIRADQMEFVPFLNTLSDFIFTVSWHISHYYETWSGFGENGQDDEVAQ